MSIEPTFYPRASGSSTINIGKRERYFSIAAGAVLAIAGLKSRDLKGVAGVLGGIALLHRGLSGHCMLNDAIGRNTAAAGDSPAPVEVKVGLIVRKPPQEVYAYWRRLENLPTFMHHLEEVRQYDTSRSYWRAKLPGGIGHVDWVAEIVRDDGGSHLEWRSLPGADIDNSGEVQFRDAGGGRATELFVTISYRPPQGYIGAQVGRLLNPRLHTMIRNDIRRFRDTIEGREAADA